MNIHMAGMTQWIRRRPSANNVDQSNRITYNCLNPATILYPWTSSEGKAYWYSTDNYSRVSRECVRVCEANLCWCSITGSNSLPCLLCSAGWPVAALWRLFVLRYPEAAHVVWKPLWSKANLLSRAFIYILCFVVSKNWRQRKRRK